MKWVQKTLKSNASPYFFFLTSRGEIAELNTFKKLWFNKINNLYRYWFKCVYILLCIYECKNPLKQNMPLKGRNDK